MTAAAIGLVYDETEAYLRRDAFCAPIEASIRAACAEAGREVVYVDARDPNAETGGVAGGLYLAAKSAEAAARLRARLPAVLVLPDLDDPVPPAVVADDAEGGRIAARTLLGAGRRHLVALVARDRAGAAPPYRRRAEAFLAEARAAGAEAEVLEASLWHVDGADGAVASRSAGETLANLLLSLPRRPDGIMAVNDLVAEEAAGWLAEAGVAVPGQVSIVGFDNLPTAGPLDVTTVRVPKAEIGRAAVDLLLDALSGRPRPAGTRLLVPSLLRRAT